MLETLLFMTAIGAISFSLQRRAARKAGIPWSQYMKMTPEEKKKAGIRL